MTRFPESSSSPLSSIPDPSRREFHMLGKYSLAYHFLIRLQDLSESLSPPAPSYKDFLLHLFVQAQAAGKDLVVLVAMRKLSGFRQASATALMKLNSLQDF